jgi:hypothetical protein
LDDIPVWVSGYDGSEIAVSVSWRRCDNPGGLDFYYPYLQGGKELFNVLESSGFSPDDQDYIEFTIHVVMVDLAGVDPYFNWSPYGASEEYKVRRGGYIRSLSGRRIEITDLNGSRRRH